MRAQAGVFALGTTDHCYLEFDVTGAPLPAVRTLAALALRLGSIAGVNVVVGVRPSVWAGIAGARDVPAGVADWTEPIVGPDGFTMPATPHDLWVWVSGGDRTAVFDASRSVIALLRPHADVADETTGWVYQHDRDLTGFIDGTENPTPLEAPDVVATPDEAPGAGGTVVLHQLWRHDTTRWEAEPVARQEAVMGRTKADSTEFDDDVKPADAHIARTVVEVDGEELDIYRRNVAYGGVTDHGTVFVGFSHDQWRLAEMLRRMAGVVTETSAEGVRDALTRYTTPLTGAYYVVPSVEALVRLGDAPDDVRDGAPDDARQA